MCHTARISNLCSKVQLKFTKINSLIYRSISNPGSWTMIHGRNSSPAHVNWDLSHLLCGNMKTWIFFPSKRTQLLFCVKLIYWIWLQRFNTDKREKSRMLSTIKTAKLDLINSISVKTGFSWIYHLVRR